MRNGGAFDKVLDVSSLRRITDNLQLLAENPYLVGKREISANLYVTYRYVYLSLYCNINN
jgi:hypothetical protein